MLNVIFSGIVTGALYAVVGMGLVAVYRVSKVLNFALGATGAAAAYLAYTLLDHHVPYVVVVVVATASGAVIGGLIDVAIARPLRALSPLTIGLATLGALLVIQGILEWHFGFDAFALRPPVTSQKSVDLGGLTISLNQVVVLVICLAASAVLGLVLTRTRLGLAMRAVSAGPHTASVLGIDVVRTRSAAWLIGGAYGALASLLIVPFSYLSPSSPTAFLLSAFAAIVLGGFTSLSGVFLGALFYGVTLNLAQAYISGNLLATYSFVIVATVLVLRPNGVFGFQETEVAEPHLPPRSPGPRFLTRRLSSTRSGRASRASLRTRTGGAGVAVVVCALVPFVASESNIFLFTTAATMFIAVMGLNVLAGYTGQVSVGHAGFMAVGAYAAGISGSRWGFGVAEMLITATVVAAVAGIAVGVPATRLKGIYLTVLTLTFAAAIPELIKRFDSLTDGVNGMVVLGPEWLNDTRSRYWFCLAIAVVVAAVVWYLGSSSVGRRWRAVRDSEPGSRSVGLTPGMVKLGAFALSAGVTGLAGGLSGLAAGFIDPTTYNVFLSVYLLLAVVIGGSGSVLGSLIGALFIVLIPQYLPSDTIPPDVVFGAVLIIVLLVAPGGLAGALTSLAARVSTWRPQPTTPIPEPAGVMRGQPRDPAVRDRVVAGAARATPILTLSGLGAGYGRGEVLRDVDLQIGRGEVVALLGANGAGKSTLLRAISGLTPVRTGTIRWTDDTTGGTEITDPHRAARAGISHVPEGRGIFPDLSVDENLRLGEFALARHRGSAGKSSRNEVFDLFPRLRERLTQRAGSMSGGEQQMLAIGRALMARPRLIMLDEPSLGLSPLLTSQVFDALRSIAASGTSVLVVEQNARAALDLAGHAYVITGGRITFDGAVSDLMNDDHLVSAYLGGEAHA